MLILDQELQDFVKTRIPAEYIKKFFYSYDSGRRIRPTLMKQVCEKYEKNFDNIKNAASAIEILHSATLIHDDIIDDDTERREHATFHKQFGVREGILCGDLFATVAFEIMLEYYPKNVQLAFTRTLRDTIQGQLMEIVGINDKETYLNYIKKKTASLFYLCVSIPDMVFDLNNANLLNFGKEFGMAFQIANDLKRKVTENYNILSYMSRKEAEKLLEKKVAYLNSLNVIPVESLGF